MGAGRWSCGGGGGGGNVKLWGWGWGGGGGGGRGADVGGRAGKGGGGGQGWGWGVGGVVVGGCKGVLSLWANGFIPIVEFPGVHGVLVGVGNIKVWGKGVGAGGIMVSMIKPVANGVLLLGSYVHA